MGILILGVTICPICCDIITNRDSYFSFPAFVVNLKDPLYFFNDTSFHERCLKKVELTSKAKEVSYLYIKNIRPENRKCLIRGNLITDYHRHIFIERLASGKYDFLYQFNYKHIDKNNLPFWNIKEQFLKALDLLVASKNWKEIDDKKYLKRLIFETSSTPNSP